ncbi:MAG TPA: flippase, partial [Thermoanaerobaculia bacterium]
AIAFVSLFTAVATLGLDGLLVRDVAREPGAKEAILGTAFRLRLGGAVVSAVVAVVAIALLKPERPNVWILVAVIAAGALFQAFDVIDFWFQAQIRSRYAVYARTCAVVVGAVLKIGLIAAGAPLLAFAIVNSAELAMIAAGLAVAYHLNGQRLRDWSFSAQRAGTFLSEGWPLIVSGLAIYVQARIDQVMLGEMLGDSEVGQYSVAMRLIEAVNFLPMIIYSSVAPTVTHAKAAGEERYHERLRNIYRLMFIIFIVTALPIYLFSDIIVRLLYGDAYREAGVLLSLFAVRIFFTNFGVARSLFIVNENLFRHALMAAVSGSVVNVALNYWLIPPYRSAGAIVATILSFLVTVFLYDLVSARARVNVGLMLKAIVTPWRLRFS